MRWLTGTAQETPIKNFTLAGDWTSQSRDIIWNVSSSCLRVGLASSSHNC